ncbi:MAG: hypothetical protein PHW63_00655 [Alphaproteobacteria bacterium]|nr:hypothetical protein [Alphaproteobacteria bacterium]
MKKSLKRTTHKVRTGQAPCPERFQHGGGLRRDLIKSHDKRKPSTLRYRARWSSPLDRYCEMKLIGYAQYEAGIRFWKAYHRAVSGGAACSARASRIDSPARLCLPDRLRRAFACVEQAYAVLTADVLGVVIDVCAYDQPAASPQELDLLRKGLGRLAQEWGIAASELCHRKKG